MHISIAFVRVQLLCHYPPEWNESPAVFFLPKSSDATVVDLVVENLVRPSVFATTVVPIDEIKAVGKLGACF